MKGFYCRDCKWVCLFDEAITEQIHTRHGPATRYRCPHSYCGSPNVEERHLCDTCQVALPLPGYDECAACNDRTELKQLAEIALDRRLEENRRRRDRWMLIDIAMPGFGRSGNIGSAQHE